MLSCLAGLGDKDFGLRAPKGKGKAFSMHVR